LVVNCCLGVAFWLVREVLPDTSQGLQIVRAILLACVWAGIVIVVFRKTIAEKVRCLKKIH